MKGFCRGALASALFFYLFAASARTRGGFFLDQCFFSACTDVRRYILPVTTLSTEDVPTRWHGAAVRHTVHKGLDGYEEVVVQPECNLRIKTNASDASRVSALPRTPSPHTQFHGQRTRGNAKGREGGRGHNIITSSRCFASLIVQWHSFLVSWAHLTALRPQRFFTKFTDAPS